MYHLTEITISIIELKLLSNMRMKQLNYSFKIVHSQIKSSTNIYLFAVTW